MNVSEKVALCAIKHADQSHIQIDASACAACDNQPCLFACPAELYTLEAGKVIVDHTGCLECGTCMIICPTGSITWVYPEAGSGIRYRHG